MDLSTYFRIQQRGIRAQFERDPDCGGRVQLGDLPLGGPAPPPCTGPAISSTLRHCGNWLALDDATINYSTRAELVRLEMSRAKAVSTTLSPSGALCAGKNSKISWTPGGNRPPPSPGSTPAVCWWVTTPWASSLFRWALTNNMQQADTGTKMVHIGKNTKSTIISKGISAAKSSNSYRGLVEMGSHRPREPRNFTPKVVTSMPDRRHL